jgi:hypothetical protein
VTLPGDLLPLSAADLDAWLWRIDQTVRLVVQRAEALTVAELDWLPPDGGWPLRRVLHHLARSERLYAAALDEALLDEDPSRRYAEACRRLDAELGTAAGRGRDPSIVYAGLYGVLQSPEEVVDQVLTIEGELLRGRAPRRGSLGAVPGAGSLTVRNDGVGRRRRRGFSIPGRCDQVFFEGGATWAR